MNNILEVTKLRVIHEQGIREGIRFTVAHFLNSFPPSLEEEFYQKVVDYLFREYYSESSIEGGL